MIPLGTYDAEMRFPLSLGADGRSKIDDLTAMASARVVNMRAAMMEAEINPEQFQLSLQRSAAMLTPGCRVIYTHEDHDGQLMRHLSVGLEASNLVPHRSMILKLAAAFGFSGDMEDWCYWVEEFQFGRLVLNLMQKLDLGAAPLRLN